MSFLLYYFLCTQQKHIFKILCNIFNYFILIEKISILIEKLSAAIQCYHVHYETVLVLTGEFGY